MGRIGKIHLANISRYVSQAEVATVAHANLEAQPLLLDLKHGGILNRFQFLIV